MRRGRAGLWIGALVALVAVALIAWRGPLDQTAGDEGDGDSAGALTPDSGRAFASESAFNTPIGDDVEVDANSEAMVDLLVGDGYGTVAAYKHVPPVYDAGEDTERREIECLETWGRCDLEQQPVPIPDGARPSFGPDKNMVVIDWSTRTVYEFFRYRPKRGVVDWGAVLPLDGSGTGNAESDPGRYGAVGAGVSRLAGLVRPWEVVDAEIPHALVGASGYSCEDVYRYPARKTDGWSDHPACLPEGARVQLDPDVDCEGLPDIEPWQLAICEALQRYGWYNIDNADFGMRAFTVQLENPAGGEDPYPSLGIEDNDGLGPIPLHRLRVLTSWDGSS